MFYAFSSGEIVDMLRILHFADLHLDTPFSSMGRGSQISNERREGLRQVVKRTLSLARERSVDIVTVGGDLYNSDYVSRDTGQFLRQQFSEIAPIRVFIAPGNHDPYTRSSLYAEVDWPNNVHIFTEPVIKPIALNDSISLWGAVCQVMCKSAGRATWWAWSVFGTSVSEGRHRTLTNNSLRLERAQPSCESAS